MYAPAMGCERESRPEYYTTNCSRKKDKTQDEIGVYQISEQHKCTGTYTVHLTVLVPGFYSREDVILLLRRRLLVCQGETHRSVNDKGTK